MIFTHWDKMFVIFFSLNILFFVLKLPEEN